MGGLAQPGMIRVMTLRQSPVEIDAAWIQAIGGAVGALTVFSLGVLATLTLQHFANRRADRERTQQLAVELTTAIARLQGGVNAHEVRWRRQPRRYLVPVALFAELFVAALRREPRNLTLAVKAAVDNADAETAAAMAAVEPLSAQLSASVTAFSMHPDRELREAAFAVNDAAQAMVQAHLVRGKSSREADAELMAAASRFRTELERSTKIRPRKARLPNA